MATRKKLTQRQYLNVMTISVAFMILIFVIIGKIMEDKTEPVMSERPFSDLTKMMFGDWHAVYQSGQWQQQPKLLNEVELNQLMQAWRELSPYGRTNQISGPVALFVELEIAQHSQVWQLRLADQPLLMLKDNNNAIILTKLQLSLLFPEKLLRAQVK